MKIKDFGVEQWMNKYETKARYNLGETCVAPFSLRGLLEVAGVDEEEFTTKLLDTRLTYGAIEGADELKQGIAQLYRTPLAPDNIVTEHGAIGANQPGPQYSGRARGRGSGGNADLPAVAVDSPGPGGSR